MEFGVLFDGYTAKYRIRALFVDDCYSLRS